ncbi:iron-dicitrate transporter subunit FecD [Lysinibacillus sp. KCTC 33748]|uniref:FecCD family ABC transporter permease n=1 Tax=unclassified Lysinibacillus TaxID=2636778 RepID=UPI0009A8626A|nr:MULTISPECIES: iron chelate uptake ABC transporter family permease subunit [unclassified Lysinibacillus]OXS72612.1 iron-dicitrate transporter subunit FecD [Lysinibacillus sp. KCTC 33748]SKB91694.1 iron complex transport system permease protein [Lysinibacillus sp. AC-3]
MIRKKKPNLLISICGIILLAFSFISLGIGSISISPIDIFSDNSFILFNYRLPRMIIAIIVGASLAVAGAILQIILKNPLASPDVVGVTKGASLFAVASMILLPNALTIMLPISALLGAVTVATILLVFAYKQGAKTHSFALIGIALSAICQAGIQFFIVKFPDNVNTTLLWLTGSLWGRSWNEILFLIPCIILLPIMLLFARKLEILGLGDKVAASLGENVQLLRYSFLSVSVILTGASVAVVGSIGFIGLVVPHLSKRLVDTNARRFLTMSAILGALFLLMADTIGKGLMPPVEIPAGIVTALIGAPYFLYLLRREKNK